MTSASSVMAVTGGAVLGSPSFDPVRGMKPGAGGGASFAGTYAAATPSGQLSLEVETTLIAQPSPDFAGGIGGSQGYNHAADGWQTLFDIHAPDGTAIAGIGLTDTAGIGGNYRGVNFVGLGVHSAGKSEFVRLTLSWSDNAYTLYVDGVPVFSGPGAGLDIGRLTVGYSQSGFNSIKDHYVRNVVLASRPVNFPTDPAIARVAIYGDSFVTQANPFLLGSTGFESTAGFQLRREMNNAGMTIGELVLRDYPGETLNAQPQPGRSSFQVGVGRFAGTVDKLTDVVNLNADYVIVMGGTNDAAGDAGARGGLAPSFAADLLSMCRTLLNNARTTAVIVQTVMSLKGNAVFAAPEYASYVDAVNGAIRALPAAWDTAYPAESGKVRVVDLFTATGGHAAPANMEKGTLTGALDDLHPTAFAGVIDGRLIAAELKKLLATHGTVAVNDCVEVANGVLLAPGATLAVALGGTSPCSGYGRYSTTQLLTLDGPILSVSLAGGFQPAPDQSFQILGWSVLQGTFAAVNLPSLPAGLSWDQSRLYESGLIKVQKPPAPGIRVQTGASQTLAQGATAAPVVISLAGGGALRVTATSSTHALLADAGVAVPADCGSPALTCSVALALVSGATGSATVSLRVQDDYGQSATTSAVVDVKVAATPSGGGGRFGAASLLALAGLGTIRRTRRHTTGARIPCAF